MKKLLLITFLFLITPDAKADMDYVCKTKWAGSSTFIAENCERNNILYISGIPEEFAIDLSAYWCRQDREINFQKDYDLSEHNILSCVLYDNKPRKLIYES